MSEDAKTNGEATQPPSSHGAMPADLQLHAAVAAMQIGFAVIALLDATLPMGCQLTLRSKSCGVGMPSGMKPNPETMKMLEQGLSMAETLLRQKHSGLIL